MKQFFPLCSECSHQFHAKAPCSTYDFDLSGICRCEGDWYDTTKAISGFCYIIGTVTPDAARAAHAACPGVDYPYPCECECHDAVSSS